MELGLLLALELLHRQRPDLRIVLYGTHNLVRAPFASEQLGVETSERLSRLYAEATVGLSLSLTNYSLIPNEMLACGLPVVELAGRACEGLRLGRLDSHARALTRATSPRSSPPFSTTRRGAGRLSRAGLDFVRTRTWSDATDTIEHALRSILAARVDAPRSPAWSRIPHPGRACRAPLPACGRS